MMKVYVAGKNLERAKNVIDDLRKHGYEITYDWVTAYSDVDPVQKAAAELRGVRNADFLVYLWESDQESARYETGMAMGLGKKIIVSGGPDAFFFKLPNIVCVNSDDLIVRTLNFTKIYRNWQIFHRIKYPSFFFAFIIFFTWLSIQFALLGSPKAYTINYQYQCNISQDKNGTPIIDCDKNAASVKEQTQKRDVEFKTLVAIYERLGLFYSRMPGILRFKLIFKNRSFMNLESSNPYFFLKSNQLSCGEESTGKDIFKFDSVVKEYPNLQLSELTEAISSFETFVKKCSVDPEGLQLKNIEGKNSFSPQNAISVRVEEKYELTIDHDDFKLNLIFMFLTWLLVGLALLPIIRMLTQYCLRGISYFSGF